MKKKIAAFVAVVMMMATFSIPVFAIDNGQQDSTENCFQFFCDMFDNIEQKILEVLGFDNEQKESDSEECSGCTFEVESPDTKIWMAYIGEEYFQFEVTPLQGGLKNVKIKKLDNLNKIVYHVPNVKFIEIYGDEIFIINGNGQLMSINVSDTQTKFVADNATQFVWIGMNGNHRLAFFDEEGKTILLGE